MNETPWWHDGNQPPADPLGNAATEASRLFEVLRERMLSDPATLRTGLRLMEAFTVLRGSGEPVAPGGAPECAYCPVCQAIAKARTMDADTVERLTGAAMEFAETVRRTVSSDSGASEESDGVRHVPLDDDLGDDPGHDDLGPVEVVGEDPVGDTGESDPIAIIDEEFLGWPVDDEPPSSGGA